MRITKNTLLISTLMLVMGAMGTALAADKEATVRLGEDGKLKYIPDAEGNLIPDFSRAGYMGGGVKLPDVPVVKTLSPSQTPKEDDTTRIQAAIDEVCELPLETSGFRGALLLTRGTYYIKGTLTIHASGVVLRGEGQKEDGTVIRGTRNPDAPQRTALLEVQSKTPRKIEEIDGSRREIADSYVPWGVTSFTLKSATGLSVGDNVVVYRPWTMEWVVAVGMKKEWSVPNEMNALNFHFERQIVAIEGNRITLNAPTVNAMEDKFGGGFVYRYKETGGLTQVGVEHLRFVAEYEEGITGRGDKARPRSAVMLNDCVNSWARNITGVYFDYATVRLAGSRSLGSSKFVTVQDCAYLKPMGASGGGNRYPFPIDNGQFCLVQRCLSDSGSRHSYVAGAWSRGPNVYLDCINGGDAGPHHRWAMGALYDNINGGKHIVPDRRKFGAHGWSGAQIVHWNGKGWSVEGTQQPTARNYFFGMIVRNGEYRSKSPVEPRSLYLKQLEDRMGKEAVENVTTEGQRKAVTDEKSEMSRDKLVWHPISFGIGEKDR